MRFTVKQSHCLQHAFNTKASPVVTSGAGWDACVMSAATVYPYRSHDVYTHTCDD